MCQAGDCGYLGDIGGAGSAHGRGAAGDDDGGRVWPHEAVLLQRESLGRRHVVVPCGTSSAAVPDTVVRHILCLYPHGAHTLGLQNAWQRTELEGRHAHEEQEEGWFSISKEFISVPIRNISGFRPASPKVEPCLHDASSLSRVKCLRCARRRFMQV